MTADKIYLVGFMGAGKSTVARVLGRRLGWRAVDIDDLIEARERRSISTIFAQQGEPYFRQVERDVVASLVADRDLVVATGGGTFEDPGTRAMMLASGAVAWLDIPLATVIDRVPPDGRRPLAQDRARLEQLYLRRLPTYELAHTRIDASGPVDDVVERLLSWVGY